MEGGGGWVVLRQKLTTFFLSQIRYRIFYYLAIFLENAVFSEETAKNSSGTAFDHFSGKGGVLGKQLILHFLSGIR